MLLVDLDRTLVDLQSFTDDGAALADVPRGVVMPTVVEVLDQLRPAGVAVVTLLPVDAATQALVNQGIGVGPGQPVDPVIGRDSRIRPKPWPDGLLAACERLGSVPGRATMIGDATEDQEAAARAGAAFVGVPSTPTGFAPGVPVVRTFAEGVRLVLGE